RSAPRRGDVPRGTPHACRSRRRTDSPRCARARREGAPRPRRSTRTAPVAQADSRENDGPEMRRGDLRRALALVRRRTHRDPPLSVRLMEKDGCPLCADAHRALRRAALDLPLEIERVDIATLAPDMRDRYELRIPVLVVGDDELDAAGLEDPAIVRWLRHT